MTDRKRLYSGVGYAAWGYFFLYFDVKFGSVSILPSFVGMLLFLNAISTLKEERRDLALLRPLGILLALWHLGNWLLSWLGTSLDAYLSVVGLIVGMASMYFHFQLLTDFAALAAKYQTPDSALDRRLLKWRTLQTLLLTVMTLLTYPSQWLPDWWEYVVIGMAIVYLIAGFCLMLALFDLRRIFRDGGETVVSEQTLEN